MYRKKWGNWKKYERITNMCQCKNKSVLETSNINRVKESNWPAHWISATYLSSFNYGGLNLAVFRQFRHSYTRHYFYPPQYNPS